MLWMLTKMAVDDGCYGEVLRGYVTGEKRVSGKMGLEDEVVNEGDESSSIRISRVVLTDNDVFGGGVCGDDEGGYEFGFSHTGNKDIFCVKERWQFLMPLQLNCRMALE